MNTLYCRLYQNVMKLAVNFLSWREPKTIVGENKTGEIGKLIKSLGYSNVLIVTDQMLRSLGLLELMIKGLDEEKITYSFYDNIKPNPTIYNVEEALEIYKTNMCQCMIAFGGGSVIDTAKTVGARVARPNKSVAKMRGQLKIRKKIPDIIAVPTTAGTGSETTLAAVITNPDKHDKYAINDTVLIPSYAVLDAMVTVKLPQKVTSTTGMDALTHAVEAYIGNSNTKRTREKAINAVKLVFTYLYRAYENGNDIEARENMQIASYDAGVAFTRAYVGYVHALAHALGGYYGTPHGLANAVLLPYVLEKFGPKAYKRLAELYDVVKPNENKSNEAKAKSFILMIKELNKKMNIPLTIHDLKKEDIHNLALHAAKEGNPLYPVPRIFKLKEFEEVYEQVLEK